MRTDRLRLRDIRNTSTFRLTMLLGIVSAAGLIALVLLIYVLSAHELTFRTDRVLRREAAALRNVPAQDLPQRITAELAHNTSGLTYIALQSRDGELVAGNLHVAADFPVGEMVNVPGRPGRHPPVRVLALPAATGETILIGRDITTLLDLRRRVMLVLVLSGVGIALLVLVTGVLLSLPALRRLRDLQRTSREIAAGRFELRMPISRRGDELDLFAATVNTMIEEVARVVAQVKEVTDAIAHDLRTPLTRLRGQLRQIEASAVTSPEVGKVAGIATAELDAVLERFAALLRISELEARGRRANFGTIVIGPLLDEVCELFEPLAEERGLTLNRKPDDARDIRGDRQLLFEAVANIVDNALKFSAPGGRVTLHAFSGAAVTVIEVADTGPGVPADEREAVLRRFHRGTSAGAVPGTGLGLSVVAAIVHLHGFTLELGDAAPGLRVRIRCPHPPAG